MTEAYTTRTTTGNLGAACIRRGHRGPGAKIVIVASDSRDVQEWLYRYLEPYESKGYGFYLVQRELDFYEYAGKAESVTAFIEDGFFGERTLGKLDNVRKQYKKLRLVLFSASHLAISAAARYLCWSQGSYLSLRDCENEIRESVEMIFRKQKAVPSCLRDSVDEYERLPGIEPCLTRREIEIIRCVAEEKTAEETASSLMVSRSTVQNHISSIYQKFNVRNKAGIIKLAVSKGIIPIEDLLLQFS